MEDLSKKPQESRQETVPTFVCLKQYQHIILDRSLTPAI